MDPKSERVKRADKTPDFHLGKPFIIEVMFISGGVLEEGGCIRLQNDYLVDSRDS